MCIRCIIKFNFKFFLIGKDFNGKYHIIKKNQYSRRFSIGGDYNFYCKRNFKFKISYLLPISDEEAGVIAI